MRKSATKAHNAQGISDQLETFVHELLVELDRYLDKRLARFYWRCKRSSSSDITARACY